MRNLAPYPDDSFSVFTTAVTGKTDIVAQSALIAEYHTIKPKYQHYDNLFITNELEHLVKDKVNAAIEVPLLNLYSPSAAVVNDIRKHVQALQHRAVRYTCQYCTLESPRTMDHIVPKGEFPEFAIHPKNLIPCCGTCNQYKGERWRIGLNKNLINFYLDQLPNERYLEVEVFLDNFGEIDFQYRLRYHTGMSYDTYRLILRHFTKLHLLQRMREAAIKHLTEFQNSIRPRFDKGESQADLTLSTLESCNADRLVLGINHWKPAMIEALVNSPVFWNTF